MSEPAAASAARAEASQWLSVASTWHAGAYPEVTADLAPHERAVVGFFDPTDDLAERAGKWSYPFDRGDLADLARFAAALAVAEADAWRDDHPHIATQAYEQRRFLVGDRMLHWAVPWLDAVGRCYPDLRDTAHGSRDQILDIVDHHRPAPVLVDRVEGLHLPGHDSLGPIERSAPLHEWLGSVWSGLVVLQATLESMTATARESRVIDPTELPGLASDLAILYQVASARWRRIADLHPGAARIWLDLSARATRTSADLAEIAG